MPLNSAFDPARPNGSGRRQLGDPVRCIFRVYRKQAPVGFGDLGDGFVDDARRLIRQGRSFIQDLQGALSPRGGPLTGLILEREVKCTLLLEGTDEAPEIRTSFNYTSDRWFIDKPFRNARGVTRFRMRGRTYWAPVLVDGVPVDGDAALMEFQQLVADYLYPREGSPADRVMYFYNLNAPISGEDQFGEFEWLVEPVGVGPRVLQTAAKPFLRFWQFEFLGLQSNRDRAKAEDGFLAGLQSRHLLKHVLELFGLEAFGDFLDSVFGAIDDFLALLRDVENLITTVNDYIQGAADFIKYSFGKIRALITAVETIVGRVEDGIDLLRSLPDLVSTELELAQDQLRVGWPGLEAESENGILLCDEAGRLRDFLLSLAMQPQAFVPSSGGTSQSRAIALRVAPGTTLERIAGAANVDLAALISLNDLQYPFVDARPRPERQLALAEAQLAQAHADEATAIANGLPLAPIQARIAAAAGEVDTWRIAVAETPSLPGVLYGGDFIRIPVERPDAIPSIIGVEGNQILDASNVTEEERLFGVDLLVTDGNLVWNDDQGDIELCRGLANIHAAQLRYLKLPYGALSFAPGIGNYAFEDLNKWQGKGTNRMLAHSLQKTLEQDPRVERIDDMVAETHGGRAFVRYRATLITGASVPDLRLPVAA